MGSFTRENKVYSGTDYGDKHSSKLISAEEVGILYACSTT